MDCTKFERTIEKIDEDILICALRYRVIVREIAALKVEKDAKVKQETRFENLLRSGI
jgi:hypothetical protein